MKHSSAKKTSRLAVVRQWIREHPWRVILFWGPLTIIVLIMIVLSVNFYQLQYRLDVAYGQLNSIHDAMSTGELPSGRESPLQKQCRATYNGFNRTIECEVELEFVETLTKPAVYEEQAGAVRDVLETVGVEDQKFVETGFDGDGDMIGYVDFMSKSALNCVGHWTLSGSGSDNPKVSYRFYCRTETPDFLPGYNIVSIP